MPLVNRTGGFLSPSGDSSAAFQPVITLAHLTTPLRSPPAIRRILNRRLRSRALSLSGVVGGHLNTGRAQLEIHGIRDFAPREGERNRCLWRIHYFACTRESNARSRGRRARASNDRRLNPDLNRLRGEPSLNELLAFSFLLFVSFFFKSFPVLSLSLSLLPRARARADRGSCRFFVIFEIAPESARFLRARETGSYIYDGVWVRIPRVLPRLIFQLSKSDSLVLLAPRRPSHARN